MNIFYKLKVTYKDDQKNLELLIENINEAKDTYKLLKHDESISDVKFYIVNETEIELQYDELFEN